MATVTCINSMIDMPVHIKKEIVEDTGADTGGRGGGGLEVATPPPSPPLSYKVPPPLPLSSPPPFSYRAVVLLEAYRPSPAFRIGPVADSNPPAFRIADLNPPFWKILYPLLGHRCLFEYQNYALGSII